MTGALSPIAVVPQLPFVGRFTKVG